MTDAVRLAAIRARAQRLSLTAEAASVASAAVLAATMLEARSDIDFLLGEVAKLYEDKFQAAYEQGKEVGRLMNATRLAAAEARVEAANIVIEAVRSLIPLDGSVYIVTTDQLDQVLAATEQEYVLIPRSALSVPTEPQPTEEDR